MELKYIFGDDHRREQFWVHKSIFFESDNAPAALTITSFVPQCLLLNLFSPGYCFLPSYRQGFAPVTATRLVAQLDLPGSCPVTSGWPESGSSHTSSPQGAGRLQCHAVADKYYNVWETFDVGGSYVSNFVIFRTKIGSNRLVCRLSGPMVHFYQFPSTRAPILRPR